MPFKTPVGLTLNGPEKTPGAMTNVVKWQIVVNMDKTVSISRSFERKQYRLRNHFAGIQVCLRMFRHIFHRIINSAEKFDDKILCGHGVSPLRFVC